MTRSELPKTHSAAAEPRDDSLMSRFERQDLMRFRARDALLAISVTAVLLVLFEGGQVHRAGERSAPGVQRSVLLAVGGPAGWVARQLPFARVARSATSLVSPDSGLGGGPGFSAVTRGLDGSGGSGGSFPLVTPSAFDPATIGAPAIARRHLRSLLVTGDSMSQPLDADLARRLDPRGVRVRTDPHIGTGISETFIVDWARLAASQVHRYHPQAVVVFIGANDGFPMDGPGGRQVSCCGAKWAAVYANRVRLMADTYRQAGAARVYWITLPAPRESARQSIARVVNAAISVGAQPWADEIRVIDTVPVFTPGGRYRDAMSVGGVQALVRQSDGIHLNDAGSSLLAGIVTGVLSRDFTF